MPFNTQTEYHRYQRYFTNISRLYQKQDVKVYTGLILTFSTIVFFALFALICAIVCSSISASISSCIGEN